jgi:hypothetical protein
METNYQTHNRNGILKTWNFQTKTNNGKNWTDCINQLLGREETKLKRGFVQRLTSPREEFLH